MILKRQEYLVEHYHSGQSYSYADDNTDTDSDSNAGHHESNIIKLNIGGEKMAV